MWPPPRRPFRLVSLRRQTGTGNVTASACAASSGVPLSTAIGASTIEVASQQTIDGEAHDATYVLVLEEDSWWVESWE